MFRIYRVVESYGDKGFTSWVYPPETADDAAAAGRQVGAAASARAYGNISYAYAAPFQPEVPVEYAPLGVPAYATARSARAPVYLRLSLDPDQPDPIAAFLDQLRNTLDSAPWLPEGPLDARVIIAHSYQGTVPYTRVSSDGARSRSERFSVAIRYDNTDMGAFKAKLALDLPVKLAHELHDVARMPVLVRLAEH